MTLKILLVDMDMDMDMDMAQIAMDTTKMMNSLKF